jgi:hypothetical protein
MSLKIKNLITASFGLMMAIGVAVAATAAEKSNKTTPLQTVGEWKIFKSDETNYNSCIARNSKYAGITLSDSKLVISIPESKDLKSYEIFVNDQIVVPTSRANLVDTTCNCVRVRNITSLSVDTASVRLQGQTSKDKSVAASVTLKDIPEVLKTFKTPVCSR